MRVTHFISVSGMEFAPNEDAFLNRLFTGPTTCDGFIRCVKRNGEVKLWALGEEYVLNLHRVFCLSTKQPDGRVWYSYGGRLNSRLSMAQRDDLATAILTMTKQAEGK